MDAFNSNTSGFIKIGADTGPNTRYFYYDSKGNIVLDSDFDPKDPWWGLYYPGYPDQPVIVGRSPIILELFHRIKKVFRHKIKVLIQGETGTGKELVARALGSVRPGNKRFHPPV